MTATNGFENITIPTYIINFKERTEQFAHIKEQFNGKPEFCVQFVEACQHKNEAIGLWQTMLKIVNIAIANDDDVIIVCEDKHEFTDSYSKDYLLNNIIEASDQGAEILSGGVGSFGYSIPLTANRFWINPFQSTQFIVLYKSIFAKMLKYKFKKTDVTDLVMAGLTSHKMVLYPYISRQKDFSNSVSLPLHNGQQGSVQQMFALTEGRLAKMQQAHLKYLRN